MKKFFHSYIRITLFSRSECMKKLYPKKKILCILLILSITCTITFRVQATETSVEKETTVSEMEENDLFARSAVLMDADSGRILFEKNAQEKLPMASTTKIMTLIVTLENGNLDDLITVSDYAASMPDVQLNIKSKEQYRLEDLLYSLMLESHNDSAVAIAESVGGSVEGFADLMNQKARDIGCYNTYFITPNGLDKTVDGREHSTTAADLAKIMSYCIRQSPQKGKFLEITRTQQYRFTNKVKDESGKVSNGNRSFSCSNHNAFLSMMEGALSGKTGFTGNAGYCYVGALERDNRTFVVALLACGWPNNRSYKWSDTKEMMSYGLENYTYHSFDEVKIDESKLQPIEVLGGQTNHIGETASADLKVVNGKQLNMKEQTVSGVLLKKGEKIDIVYQMEKKLEAPVEKGNYVGSIKYTINGETWKVINVVVEDSIKKINFSWCLKQLMKLYYI